MKYREIGKLSIYVMKDGKRVRACKFTCGTMVTWDEKLGYFIEVDHDSQRHTKERCKAFKEINQDPSKKQAVETLKEIANVTQQNNNNHTQQITLEQVQKKLASIGIMLDVEKLMRESDYIQ